MVDWVVIGAGPGGIAAAGALSRRGIRSTILERDEVAGSWRARYDRVHLNTSSWTSYLPGGRRRLVARGRFPARDALVAYYEAYVAEEGLRVLGGMPVNRVERQGDGWRLHVDGADPVDARNVIVATGKDHTPTLPDWPGRRSFSGEILHASDYRNAEPFDGRHVLVVGVGNSGSEIALDLAQSGAATVRLSIRTPPSLVHRSVLGIPNDVVAIASKHLPVRVVDELGWWIQRIGFGDLSAYGFTRPPEGAYTRLRRRGTIPTIDGGSFVKAIKRGSIQTVAGIESLDATGAVLADGTRIEPDAIIAATGYSTSLEPLVGHLGILDERGRPTAHGAATHPAAPRLHFIGFTDPLSGNIRETRIDAERIARSVAAPVRASAP